MNHSVAAPLYSQVRAARDDIGKAWLRIVVSIVLAGILACYGGIMVAAFWLGAVLTLEIASLNVRARVADGDLRQAMLHLLLPFAVMLCWVGHALLLWGHPELVARIAALMDLFTAALYGAIGAQKDKRLLTLLVAPPLLALSGMLLLLVWTTTPALVATLATLATAGTCATIALNALTLHFSDQRLTSALAALAAERDSLEARVRERTDELGAATAKAQSASHAKSQFLATMSHELRTPLNAVIGYAEMIGDDIAHAQKPSAEDAAHIQVAGKRLLAMVNNVLEFSALEAGSVRLSVATTNVGDLLQTVAAKLGRQAAINGNIIEIDAPAGLPDIETDAARLAQCLTYVADNACKFTKDGVVRLSATQRSTSAAEIEITVADTGIGISKANIERLFQPFSQISEGPARHHEGAGLGLAITHRLITALGGAIRIDPARPTGALVKLTVPIRAPLSQN